MLKMKIKIILIFLALFADIFLLRNIAPSVKADSPTSTPTPTPVKVSISWHTKDISIDAKNFYLLMNGKQYFIKPTNLTVTSTQSDILNLSIKWVEKGNNLELTSVYKCNNFSSKSCSSWVTKSMYIFVNGNKHDYKGVNVIKGNIKKPYLINQLNLITGDKKSTIHFDDLSVQLFSTFPIPTPTNAPTIIPTNSPTPTITPTPTPPQSLHITVATNLPTNQNSDPVIMPNGYKSITFTVLPSGSIPGWAAQVSFDGGATWLEQHRFACSGSTCAEVTLPILGGNYRFSPGGGSGTINVFATLNPEPDTQVLVLGQGVLYQFTSPTFNTDGFNTITITAGGGDNPQNMIGISLQRNENGGFVEKQFLGCDGGAGCPLQTLPVLGGDYRVVLEGNGTNAVLGAILRK